VPNCLSYFPALERADSLSVRVTQAADALRTNNLPRKTGWCDSCARCDFVGICRDREP